MIILVSNFRRVLHVVFFLLSGVDRCLNQVWRWNWQSDSKRRHIKFTRWGITQKKNTTYYFWLCLRNKK